uniref:Uncharacterized protein n=1 Tax=Rhizophora mucronata TaxID=61149 RepID=A0A2P2NPX6_RHIMU
MLIRSMELLVNPTFSKRSSC